MQPMIEKPKSGGSVLLEKKGAGYFSSLAKKGARKRRAAMKLWEEQEAAKLKKTKKS